MPIELGHLDASYPPECADAISEDDLARYAHALTRRFHDLPAATADPVAAQDARVGLSDSRLARQAYDVRSSECSWLVEALHRYDPRGRRVAVVTTLGPWIETLCLLFGARPTRVSPTPIASLTPRLPCITRADWQKQPGVFDDAIACGMVEQCGLGRLGDGLAVDGDRLMIDDLAGMVGSGGRLFLFLPIGKDVVVFNAGRIYGRIRLPFLLRGWKPIDAFGFSASMLDGNGDKLALLVMQRECRTTGPS